MIRRCCCCGFADENKKLFWEVGAQTGDRYICKNCAKEINKDGLFKAGLTSNTHCIKLYVKKHPEASNVLSDHLKRLGKEKEAMKAEWKEFSEKSQKKVSHLGCTKQKQTKCTCRSCGKVFFYSEYDVKKNKATVFAGSALALSQMKDLNKCPECGSIAIEKKQVLCWLDSNGSCVDIEE